MNILKNLTEVNAIVEGVEEYLDELCITRHGFGLELTIGINEYVLPNYPKLDLTTLNRGYILALGETIEFADIAELNAYLRSEKAKWEKRA